MDSLNQPSFTTPACVTSYLQLTKEDYLALWPHVAPRIQELANHVSNGRGFQIVR